jgi:hypothetical protein
MAFDERLASRVRALLAECGNVTERRMFAGLTFMVSGHICCGVNNHELIVRLAPDDEEAALRMPHARPMDFTNRPMSGFVTIAPAGLGLVALCFPFRSTVAHRPSDRRDIAWLPCPCRRHRVGLVGTVGTRSRRSCCAREISSSVRSHGGISAI